MRRLEPALAGLFIASWLFGLLDAVGLSPLSGALNLSFYALYTCAAVLGWVAGNLYNARRLRLPPEIYRRLLLLWAAGPAGLVILLRSLAPKAAQEEGPWVWLYALGVYAVFFLVPVATRPKNAPPPPRIGSRNR